MPNYIRQIAYRWYYHVKADNEEQAGEIALEWAMDGTEHDDEDEYGLIDRKCRYDIGEVSPGDPEARGTVILHRPNRPLSQVHRVGFGHQCWPSLQPAS
jgi:hypothetical protein